MTESPEPMELHHLVTDDPAVPHEQAEVEIEWVLLQSSKNGPDIELENKKELGADQESVPRRYEFYKYIGTYDPETHEADCDNPNSNKAACQIPGGVVGEYIGAQMAAINVEQALAVLDPELPHGQAGARYPDRPLVFGGTGPSTISVMGDIPPGFDRDLLIATGVLSGTPSAGGTYMFTVDATDALGAKVTRMLTLFVASIPCVGACSGGDQVQAEDLIKLVHDALGSDPAVCPAGNPGGGAVTIDVVMTAMKHHMMGHCPMG